MARRTRAGRCGMTMDGVIVETAGGSIRLKWHRLRDASRRPAHSRKSLASGLAHGALLEADLWPTADGHWVCLHDATLDAETDGSGPVAAATRAQLERLHQRAPDGSLTVDRVLFLDELVASLAASPSGHIQLDLKLGSDDPAARARFGEVVAPQAKRFDISGQDWHAVLPLMALAPGMRGGFDPCARLEELPMAEWCDHIASVPAAEAQTLYLDHRLVTAAHRNGLDLIGYARARGQEVDCWTVDPAMDGIAALLRLLADLRCHQVTTDDPIELEALWRSLW